MLESKAWGVDQHDTKPLTFSGVTNCQNLEEGCQKSWGMDRHSTKPLAFSNQLWQSLEKGAERAWSVDQHDTQAVNNDMVVTDPVTVIITSRFEHSNCSGCLADVSKHFI